MGKKRFLLLATGALLAASCHKEILTDDLFLQTKYESRFISVDAGLPQQSFDKAYLDPSSLKVKWEPNDQICINGTSLAASEIYAPDSITARFSGNVNAIIDNGDKYWAVYPANIRSNETASLLTVNIPSTQSFDISKPMHGNTYMAGYASVATGTTDVSFQMKNLVTLLKIPVTSSASNKNLSKITVSVSGDNNICLYGSFTTTNPATVPISGGSAGYVTVNCSNGNNPYIELSSTTQYVYVALPPIASTSAKITVMFYNTDNKYTRKSISLNQSLERNKIYTLGTNPTTLDFSTVEGISVSQNTRVLFAPGNLQWSANGTRNTVDATGVAGTFRFAEHQWDYVGDATHGTVYVNGTKCDNALISQSYTGWIDLFCWGTSGWNSGANKYSPYDYSSSQLDYYPGADYNNDLTGNYANADWGIFNDIYNPSSGLTDRYGTWRLFTSSEWEYLMTLRTTTSAIRFAKGKVHGVNGLIIVPDNWDINIYTLNSFNDHRASFSTNIISDQDWAVMEQAGCVFLPTAGARFTTDSALSIGDLGYGYYWTSTHIDAYLAYRALVSDNFTDFDWSPDGTNYSSNHDGNRHRGESVRLIRVVSQ